MSVSEISSTDILLKATLSFGGVTPVANLIILLDILLAHKLPVFISITSLSVSYTLNANSHVRIVQQLYKPHKATSNKWGGVPILEVLQYKADT